MDDSHFIEMQRLFEIVHRRGLSELTLTREDFTISISAVPAPAAMPVLPGHGDVPPVAPAPPAPAPAPASAAEPPAPTGYAIESPLIGTFYRAPSPDADNFVEVGDDVKIGQTVCIVEAMKVFNEITADRAGRVKAIPAQNGQLVQAGQPLVILDTDA